MRARYHYVLCAIVIRIRQSGTEMMEALNAMHTHKPLTEWHTTTNYSMCWARATKTQETNSKNERIKYIRALYTWSKRQKWRKCLSMYLIPFLLLAERCSHGKCATHKPTDAMNEMKDEKLCLRSRACGNLVVVEFLSFFSLTPAHSFVCLLLRVMISNVHRV